MNRLDTKLLANIIGHLRLVDRIKMRLVAKKFKKVVDSIYLPKDLVLATDNDFFNRWRVSNTCIDYRSSVISSLNLSAQTTMLENLERLKVKFQLSYDDLKRLQRFPKLMQLEVGLLELGSDGELIRLPNLRTLYVAEVNHEERGCLTIDSPSIQNVYFRAYAIEFIKFVDYKTILLLEFNCDRTKSCLAYTNLVLGICNRILDLPKDTLIALAKLPELLSLHCNVELMRSTEDRPEEESLKRLREVYDLLMRLQEGGELRSELTCFIHDVPLIKSRSFDDYHFENTHMSLHHENAHHTLTEKSPSMESISYSNFLQTVRRVSKSAFLKRYLNIQCVDVFGSTKKFKFSRLVAFLKVCQQIRSLLICYLDIKYRNLVQLPSLPSLENLACFQLIHCRKIELDFVHRWAFLDHLKTNLINVERITILKKLNPGVYEFFVDAENSILVRKHKRANSYDLYLVVCGEGKVESHPNLTFGGLFEILQRVDGLFPLTHWLDRGNSTEQLQ